MKRKTIVADYETHIDENNKKTYTYIGPLYHVEWTKKERKIFLLLSWLLVITDVILFVLMARLNTGSTRQIMVTLPFVGLFMPLGLLLSDAYKLTINKGDMTRTQYERGYAQQTRCTIAAAVLMGITLLMDVVYWLTTPGAFNQKEAVFFGLGTLMLALFLLFLLYKKRIKVKSSR